MGKTFNRYEKILSMLPDTLEWSRAQDVSEASKYLLAPDGLPRIFLGSGGSFSAAQLAMPKKNKSVEVVYTISDSILDLPIANISRVNGNIVRGETLWASRNRKYLDNVKEAGVDVIIDFRTADFTDKFSEICNLTGIEYHHFPIDKAVQSDDEMLKYLPTLFDLLDNRNCYISCQQGLHRTDIALSLYYMFHRPEFVPDLIGHKKKGELRCDDIMRRVNSLYGILVEKGDDACGIKIFNEAEFRRRRKLLLEMNRRNIAAKH